MGAVYSRPWGKQPDNSHIMRVLTDGERVLFDQVGPGVMTWMRHQQDYGSPWRLYLDGNYVTIAGPGDLGQLNPSTFPARAFPYPLSMHVGQTQGSSILAATIPFNQSMMWTAANPNGNFYSLYRKLPYGTPLTTWTGSEPVTDVVQPIEEGRIGHRAYRYRESEWQRQLARGGDDDCHDYERGRAEPVEGYQVQGAFQREGALRQLSIKDLLGRGEHA